jgi:hypothetical protein
VSEKGHLPISSSLGLRIRESIPMRTSRDHRRRPLRRSSQFDPENGIYLPQVLIQEISEDRVLEKAATSEAPCHTPRSLPHRVPSLVNLVVEANDECITVIGLNISH